MTNLAHNFEFTVYRKIGTDTLVGVIYRPGKPTTRLFLEGALSEDPPIVGDHCLSVLSGEPA